MEAVLRPFFLRKPSSCASRKGSLWVCQGDHDEKENGTKEGMSRPRAERVYKVNRVSWDCYRTGSEKKIGR